MYVCTNFFCQHARTHPQTHTHTHTHTTHPHNTTHTHTLNITHTHTHTHSQHHTHTHTRTHTRAHTNYTLDIVFFQTYPSSCLHQRSTSNIFQICAYKLVANASHTHMYAYVYKMSLKVVGQCAEKVLRIFLPAHYLYESTQ